MKCRKLQMAFKISTAKQISIFFFFKSCFMDRLCFIGFSLQPGNVFSFYPFEKNVFITPLITKCIVPAKGVRAAKTSPSVSKISLKCIYAISLSIYFITKLHQSIFYIGWSIVRIGKSDRGYEDV